MEILNDRLGGVLSVGRCEPLKATVHGVAVGIAGLCAAYNAAAWLHRRQVHLAINTLVYSAAVLWECQHVMSHLNECVPATPPVAPPADGDESLTDAA